MKKNILFLLLALIHLGSYAQRKDKGIVVEKTNFFFDSIQKMNEAYNKKMESPEMVIKMDFSTLDYPNKISDYKLVKAFDPVSQGETGTCWSFATHSYFEAEIMRLQGRQIKLSEMYIVYWQYVEKAREYVHTLGESNFDEGSQANAVIEMMKKYGSMPEEAYSGMKIGQPFHYHDEMVAELKAYLQGVKAQHAWNEEVVLGTVRAIMDYYIGTPPATFQYEGKTVSPISFLKDICKIDPNNYIDFMSFANEPYWTQAEYKVPDNWWHSKEYYNVPLDVFTDIVKIAVKNGISVPIGGDVSNEPGMYNKVGVAAVATFDIPSEYIDENARLLRFLNGTTTDDHLMHILGYCQKPNGLWYLVKDSGSGGHNNPDAKGYWFMHEDYVKLKMTTFTVPKDLVKEVLAKMK